jgi:deoxyribonuclease-4
LVELRIGAHLTIAKGLPDAARLARAIGADTFGFHTRNPRGSAARAIPPEEVAAWEELRRRYDLGPLVGHLPYTINLGTPKEGIWEFGKRVVREDLQRCDAFGAYGIVLHPGHCSGDDVDAGVERVAAALAEVLDGARGVRTLLLLEGMAGQTGEIGATPAQLGAILDRLGRPDGLGVCLDTCHLFASGYDLRTRDGVDAMLADFGRWVGLERVRALHLNDSKFGLGSRKDRHELLGRGELGRAGLAAVLGHPFLRELPIIIETPVDRYEEYAGEVATARELAG